MSRELARNAATGGGKLQYSGVDCAVGVRVGGRNAKAGEAVYEFRLRQCVQDRWEGKIHDAQGREVAGPRQAVLIGRNEPHRGVRK